MYFANYFDLKEEREKFYKHFATIDKDRDGQINFSELVEAYSFKVFSVTFDIKFKVKK